MRKAIKYAFLLTLISALALLMASFGAMSVSAASVTDKQVTATTSASVKQGNSGYCYVYIDSLKDLSTLSVTAHYDSDKIRLYNNYVYNTVPCTIYDKAVGESSVQFSYILTVTEKLRKRNYSIFIILFFRMPRWEMPILT